MHLPFGYIGSRGPNRTAPERFPPGPVADLVAVRCGSRHLTCYANGHELGHAHLELQMSTRHDAPGTAMRDRPADVNEQPDPPTVLIADDEPAIVDLLAQFLEDEGYAVERASDGRMALEMTRQSAPDLVIADVMMPGMDGFELLDELGADGHGVPVILMSAAVVSRREGVPFIAKPFDLGELLDLVTSHLE